MARTGPVQAQGPASQLSAAAIVKHRYRSNQQCPALPIFGEVPQKWSSGGSYTPVAL